jgi:hypothetical protein
MNLRSRRFSLGSGHILLPWAFVELGIVGLGLPQLRLGACQRGG